MENDEESVGDELRVWVPLGIIYYGHTRTLVTKSATINHAHHLPTGTRSLELKPLCSSCRGQKIQQRSVVYARGWVPPPVYAYFSTTKIPGGYGITRAWLAQARVCRWVGGLRRPAAGGPP